MRSKASLIAKGIGASLAAGTYYRASFVLSALSNVVRAVTVIAFWRAILTLSPSFAGWSAPSILVFMTISETFFGLSLALTSISGRFWAYIKTGLLDNYLTKPVDARLLVFLGNLDLPLLIRSLPSILVYGGLAILSGWRPHLVGLLMAFAATLLGVALLSAVQLTCSLLAFWLGPTDALDEMVNSLYEFGHYPLDVLPRSLRAVVFWALGLGFVATFPARLALGSLASGEQLAGFACVLGLTLLWGCLSHALWTAGRSIYDSFGG